MWCVLCGDELLVFLCFLFTGGVLCGVENYEMPSSYVVFLTYFKLSLACSPF
jgi:hypothetical protein